MSLLHCGRGLSLTLKTLGPFYRIVIRDGAPGAEPGAILAVSSGFTVPAMGLMHCDSLEIFTRGCGARTLCIAARRTACASGCEAKNKIQ